MRAFLDEFKKFILRGNVVELAVGMLTGGFDISKQTIHVYGDVYIGWGAFLQAVINFVIIAFCLFLVVKGMNTLHKRFASDQVDNPPEPTPTEKLLAEIRDLLKEQKPAPPPTS